MKAKNIFPLHVHTCMHTYTHTSSPGHDNACTCEPLCYALLFSSSCALNGQFQSFIKKKVPLLASGGQASYKSNLREKKKKTY